MRPRTLAEVEAQAQELVRTLGHVGGLQAQRDLWRDEAYALAEAIRRIHRHLVVLRDHFPTTTRRQELTHVIDEIVAPELVDQPATTDGAR